MTAEASVTARALVTALVTQGVRDVVLCPGSRSAPLAYALAAAHAGGWLRLHVRADERSAAFLALGLTRATDAARPAAVVTTSGTAVANLHPAVLEADHAGRPLVVLSADRPHELRGTGANQTTDQVKIFGSAVRWFAELPAGAEVGVAAQVARAVAAATGVRGGGPGPVHLNVAFREPLAPRGAWLPGELPGQPLAGRPHVVPVDAAPRAVRLDGARTVVVAGDGAGPLARHVAARGGWPLLAEPTSGARSGPNALGPYRWLLDVEPLVGDVERVVVLGRPTLSRPVSRLLARPDVEVVVVAAPGARWPDVAGTAGTVCGAVEVLAPTPPGWLDRWRRAAGAAGGVLAAHLATEQLDGLTVAHEVAAAGGVGALVLGASMAVRDVDLAGAVPERDPGVRVLANRGLAGIDGTTSTAAGLALGAGVPVRALVGDLTFLHDLAGLAVGPLEAGPDLQVVVVNDDGGAIFATLDHGDPAHADVYERVFGTPQGADLAALSLGYGARHVRVADVAGLRAALAGPVAGRSVVEVAVDRSGLREQRQALAAAARAAAVAASSG